MACTSAQGQDYSRWRDVARTLRGEYGARATREVQSDDRTSIMYVAAPVLQDDKIIGVLTVAKPLSSIQNFIDRAERKVVLNGFLLLVLSALVGVLVTLWTVWNIRKLRQYALSVQAGQNLAIPRVPGELGDLAQAMRLRLEGREYIEDYVRALTHELKSPMAAIRASGELLQDDLPAEDRAQFAGQVIAQTQRVQRLIDRMLELTRLEQRTVAQGRLALSTPTALLSCAQDAVQALQAQCALKRITVHMLPSLQPTQQTIQAAPALCLVERDLVTLAVSNLLDNAIDFAPVGSTIHVHCTGRSISVQDQGGGVPDYALARLGERFFTTARPNGERSGSGLGLAIVKQIMALHDGSLRITNTAGGLCAELIFSTT